MIKYPMLLWRNAVFLFTAHIKGCTVPRSKGRGNSASCTRGSHQLGSLLQVYLVVNAGTIVMFWFFVFETRHVRALQLLL
jgi:hypothetical protein